MKNLICALLACVPLMAETPGVVAIRNARIVPVSGPVLDTGTVVVRNGLIDAVGTNIAIPPDAWVIDGEGMIVYPGLIDGLSTLGLPDMAPSPATAPGRGAGRTAAPAPPSATPPAPPARGPEDRPLTTSWFLASDQLQVSDRRIEAARNAGYTSAATFPTRGIFAGHGALINLAGDKPGQMVVASPIGLYLTLQSNGFGSGGGYPGSLMGSIAYIRQLFLDADQYRLAKEAYAANPRGMQRPEYDKALEGVLLAGRILLPAVSAVEIDRMIRFSKEFKPAAILYGVHEGYRVPELLKNAGLPVLLNLKWPEKPRDEDPDAPISLRTLEVRDRAPSTAAALAKAGVKFAFSAGSLDRPADLGRAVRKAMEAGLSMQDALRALTLAPAEIFGVADRLGSIEKGKIANLIVTKGDLFQERTEIKYVFIDGKKMEPVAEAPAPTGEVTR